ncbi:MAG: exo-alpha-sialidase [Planctomycetaceae bacterium]|nr:exo-alpha-sialidase [Planctomycetaceae bacterium]
MFRYLISLSFISLFLSVFSMNAIPAPTMNYPLSLTFDNTEIPSVKFRNEVVWAEGVHGKGVYFDEKNNLGVVNLPNDFFKGDFTVSAWINVYLGTGRQRAILAKNIYIKNQREWVMMVDTNNKLAVYYNSGTPWERLESKTIPEPGKWYQVTLTVKNKTISLYVNGKIETTKELSGLLKPTPAPLTLGGVDNAGSLIQEFFGVIDTVTFFDRALSADEVTAMYVPTDKKHTIPEYKRINLWSGGDYPKPEQFLRFKNIRFAKVKARMPEQDSFVWQHGPSIIRFKGKFYASFGANAGQENTVGEKILMTTSEDGIHWAPCKIIGDIAAQDVGRSHGVFLEHDGKLWTFHARFVKKGIPHVIGDAFPDLSMEAYLLDESTQNWEYKGIVGKGIWPYHEPFKLSNGNWIVSGMDEDWRSAVAISNGNDLLKWNSIKVRNGGMAYHGTEANLWTKDQQHLTLLIRNEQPFQNNFNRALISFSNDYGKTWSLPIESDMPMTASKPACGVLSTGQRFLINNLAITVHSRSMLHIAVGRSGEETLSKVWTIRDVKEPIPEGAFQAASFAYPHAAEYDGKLYIIYSVGAVGAGGNNNHIELVIIPVEELNID